MVVSRTGNPGHATDERLAALASRLGGVLEPGCDGVWRLAIEGLYVAVAHEPARDSLRLSARLGAPDPAARDRAHEILVSFTGLADRVGRLAAALDPEDGGALLIGEVALADARPEDLEARLADFAARAFLLRRLMEDADPDDEAVTAEDPPAADDILAEMMIRV